MKDKSFKEMITFEQICPYPRCDKLIREGMMTAGETAASTNPSMKPTVQGKPSMRLERTATATASTKQGMKVARTTIALSFMRAMGSSSSPAIKRMTVRQMERRAREIAGSRSWPMYLGWHPQSRSDSILPSKNEIKEFKFNRI